MIRTIAFIVISLVLIFYGSASSKNKKYCTQEEAIQAESEADILKDWDSTYRSFKRYAHCDDGAISEGYSDTIGRLLAYDWKQFKRLNELCVSDKKFERFILKHIDETVPADALKIIIENVRLHCPKKASRLCKLIEAAASKPAEPEVSSNDNGSTRNKNDK